MYEAEVNSKAAVSRPRLNITPRAALTACMHVAILVAFFLVPWWLRPDWLSPGDAPYFLGFLITVPVLLAIALWLLLGAPGLTKAIADRRYLWITPLVMLTAWGFLSILWTNPDYRQVAVAWSMQFGVVALFALVCACASPAPRTIATALAAGLIFQGVIVAAQVQAQSPVGVPQLGEFEIRPQRKGLSIVVSGDEELMRPYGLTAHPNMIGGYFAAALLCLTGWLASGDHLSRWRKAVRYGVIALGLWALCVTFSRSAWGGLAIGLALILFLWWRRGILRTAWRRWVLAGAVALIVFGLFWASYHKFILARADTSGGGTETISIASRRLFIGYALQIAYEHPLNGVGIGTFAYSALEILNNSPYRGWLLAENVHNLPLLVLSELGLVGFTFWMAALIGMAYVVWRGVRDPFAIGLAAAAVAILAIGMLDHYPWSIFHFALLLWASMGVALSTYSGQSVDKAQETPANQPVAQIDVVTEARPQ